MNRRQFITTASASAITAGTMLAGAPAVHTQPKYAWKMVTTWPKNFPALGTGANYLAQAIEAMSEKRITVQVYSAGELVPPLGILMMRSPKAQPRWAMRLPTIGKTNTQPRNCFRRSRLASMRRK